MVEHQKFGDRAIPDYVCGDTDSGWGHPGIVSHRAFHGAGSVSAPGSAGLGNQAGDRCATGVLDAFLRAGVPVPDEMSVAGFDDSRLARRAPIDLTTVGQDIPRLAELAVGRAIARMEAEAAPGPETVIVPRLVVHATTAAPRRALS
ncbi:substrate-binding domain-containing protein [Streptomyces sp. Edi2]|uniref:substrate-binding domain-containing protein n=1 Tax=Streptomyces sp. Edi2 TaxID=3162528 RepID=UPI003306884C